jgi:hypothetical protein
MISRTVEMPLVMALFVFIILAPRYAKAEPMIYRHGGGAISLFTDIQHL